MATQSPKITRERILDSAEAEFAEKGFGGARVKEIAASAGVTGAMVHYYFNSKEDLHRAVLDRMVKDLMDLVSRIAPEPIDPVEKVQRFFYAFFDYAARHRNFARLTSMETGHDSREFFLSLVRTHFRPLYQLAKAFLKKGMDQGVFRSIDTDHLLTAIYGMTITYFSDSPFLDELLDRQVTSREAVAERRTVLMDMILRLLLKNPN